MGLARWAKGGRLGLRSSVAFGACFRLFWECWRASALMLHQHSKIARFLPFGAIAFPRSCNKSVLRGFLGGLFGFIGLRCIFGCLVAFVGLVGLYACRVKRLRSEKRKPAYFIGSLRLFRSYSLCASLVWLRFACAGCVGCRLWFVCCWWWFFFPLDGMTKRKGKLLGLSSLRGLWSPLLLFGFKPYPFAHLVKIKPENIIYLRFVHPFGVNLF